MMIIITIIIIIIIMVRGTAHDVTNINYYYY